MENELHQKIILNQNVVIQNREQPAIEGLKENGELVVLKLHNDIVTITPIMREILEVARTPHTPEELMHWVAQSWSCSYESIYEPVWSFLKKMGRLGVLVYDVNQAAANLSVLEELKQTMSFAGYTLLERISKNHKVALYKCVLGKNDLCYYTLKVMLKRNPDESTQRNFFREAQILAFLPEHNNIRNCLHAAVNNGVPYLLFEYIDGVSMRKKINKISLENKISIASQMMKAIDHLHSHHILHGDIHASNFLIDRENNLKLIDMGMAYHEHDDEKHHGGIPRYMPPERLPDHRIDFSKQKGDYKAEVFQIGVCLYFLFAGQYPFRGLLLTHLADAIKSKAPAPLEKTPLGEVIPDSITHVISKSMEKEPSNRYSSVAHMIDAWTYAVSQNESVLM